MAKNGTRSAPDRRVVLHVGLPKTGTTFLQASLQQNKERLRAAGVLYPSGKDDRMFRAALNVRGNHKAWGRNRADVEGAWDALCRRARKHEGITVISHELLAAATVHQIVAAMTMLKGLDVHVVVTARDPARQATAEWQEGVKHGRRLTFEQFRAQVLAGDSESDYAHRFRASQDLPAVLARWGSSVPAGRVHVVACPPPGLDRDVLWRRFLEVVGIDPGRFPAAGEDSQNVSLGTNEIDLLRQVNIALDQRLVQPEYGDVVKRFFAHGSLSGRGERPVVPADMDDDLQLIAERWVKEIERVGYPVHGSLDDLLPTSSSGSGRHPDDIDPASQVEVAATATADLLVEMQRCRAVIARLETDNKVLKKRRTLLKRRLAKSGGRH